MTTYLDLSNSGLNTEGIRALMGYSKGHLAIMDGALFIAEDSTDLDEWIATPPPEIDLLMPNKCEVIEVETRQVVETVLGAETAVQLDTGQVASDSDTEASTTDANTDSEGPAGESSEGDLINEGPPVSTRNDVISRIHSRARSHAKTSGTRQTRRTHRTGRSLL